MTRFLSSLLLLLAVTAGSALGASLLQPRDSVVIAGGSIRAQKLYSVMEDYLLA
jgi:hypothetical protein